jgi:hypothetical protein
MVRTTTVRFTLDGARLLIKHGIAEAEIDGLDINLSLFFDVEPRADDLLVVCHEHENYVASLALRQIRRVVPLSVSDYSLLADAVTKDIRGVIDANISALRGEHGKG